MGELLGRQDMDLLKSIQRSHRLRWGNTTAIICAVVDRGWKDHAKATRRRCSRHNQQRWAVTGSKSNVSRIVLLRGHLMCLRCSERVAVVGTKERQYVKNGIAGKEEVERNARCEDDLRR